MVKVEIENNELKREGDEEKKRRKRKVEGKKEVEERSVTKELFHSLIPIKKENKGFFLTNCFQKFILQDGRRKKSLFEGVRKKMCCFEERDIKSEAGSCTLIQNDLLKKIQGFREF